MWQFCSVESLNSIQNLPWHSVMARHVYVFSICLTKKCRVNWILRNYENYFSKNTKICTFVQKRKEMFYSIKIYICFVIHDANHFMYYPQMPVFSFHCFSQILPFKKGAIERILTFPYSYKLQKFEKMNEIKSLGN